MVDIFPSVDSGEITPYLEISSFSIFCRAKTCLFSDLAISIICSVTFAPLVINRSSGSITKNHSPSSITSFAQLIA